MQIPASMGIERRLFAGARGIAAVSESVAAELDGYNVTSDRIRVLGNGTDTEVFTPDEQHLGMSDRVGERYVLAVGRLDVRKGVQDLVAAMALIAERLPSMRLYVAGTGPLEGRVKASVQKLGLDSSVRLLGQVDQAKMVKLYRGATVFVHGAHYEGLPTVLLEAMACGKAVVSTAVSGALDVISDGTNALLVPPRSPERLADAICRLAGDAGLRRQLGIAARHTVEQRFSWHVVGNGYLSYYQALLDKVA
jgi:glycosyltransferase involved in cell wall biosynthesis